MAFRVRLSVGLTLIAACGVITCSGDSANGTDGGLDATVDVLDDVGFTAMDAGADADSAADAEAGVVYNDMTNAAFWTSFDLTTVDPSAKNFAGGAFDGHYVYFSPNGQAVVARYDTTSAFASTSSWSTFHANTQLTASGSCAGAAYDGHYVYFVPSAFGEIIMRYDTTATFGSTSSWSTFDLSSADAGTSGYAGAIFDSRYLYFVSTEIPNGLMARFDTTAAFTDPGSYAFYKSSSGPSLSGLFDGRYAYFLPTGPDMLALQYDTTAAFDAGSAWSTFNLYADFGHAGFQGGAFDGTYVYITQGQGGGLVVRYDPTTDFTSSAAWLSFDMTTVNANAAGFYGSAFDGRYVYFVPNAGTVVARFDTQGTFTSASAWSVYDLSAVNDAGIVNAKCYAGAVFDGRFVYFVPNAACVGSETGGLVVRFDAKSPPSMPKGYSGSFF
jgi:hypothetical protein